MGDFNCYRYETEKAGGTMSSNGRLGELNSMIFNCGVQDLSSTGLFFTWYNQRADNPIHIKLDRVLVNNALLDFLPTAYYTVESHLGSDHSPLIFNSTHDKPISVRFMFKNYWINMEGYWDDVLEAFASRSARSPMASFYHSLQMLKRAFKNRNWSSSSFLSNALLEIKSKQHQCLAELQANPLDVELNHNLKKINEELASFQANWTSWLAQRAKVLWLTKGEDDLGFLFAKIRSRNNKNCIKEIVTSEGHFITFSDISKAIIKHFESLFNSSHTTPVLPFNIPTGNMVPPHFYGMLVSPLSFEEVKKAVFDGNENTAPGPDGFTYAFYRKSWHLIGLQVFNAVNNFFVTGSLPRGVKATAIALIPKCSHATNINDFRPISLCNVLYKIVAKVLSNRLKVVLPHIIHDSQSGFITTRCSTDNIILAAEILRDFKGSTKKFCAKLDIRKAFDTVSREYIIARLLQKGFPEVFVGWIKGCISDVHFSICLNGSLEGFFKSSSGLRQGCPLSPLLFCVAMDGLSQTLSDSHNFKGIKCKDVQISHLMYADDLLVVGEATIENARHLNRCLQDFGSLSGLHINTIKSAIIFSHQGPQNQRFCEVLDIHNINPHLTYLGIPISTKKLKASHFQPLLSRIFALLEGWKNKFLSFAGRVQFLKFTISNTIAYWIRGSIIPKGCCASINKLCSKFLFHNNLVERKLHLISWSNVTLPKAKGGLGIPSIEALYFGISCSIICRFYNSKNLLSRWYKAKFISPWKPWPLSASNYWKKISTTAFKIQSEIQFFVSKFSEFSFLWDPWLHGHFIEEASFADDASLVKDFYFNDTWHLPSSIPLGIRENILAVHNKGMNEVLWHGSSKWLFKNFVEVYHSSIPNVDWCNAIWHKKHTLKYAWFAWMARLGKLKTADNLLIQGIQVPQNCSLCSGMLVNHYHLFFTCDFSFFILKSILPDFNCFLLRPNLSQTYDFIENSVLYNKTEKDFCL
ncbi:Putative ribonuclease H protein [Dendrobium catenatum]|uniref:Ribonuclease H protein n=1 Tax=Dendrobium catenatum TaxID=906689 RepID=A0A2I0VRJ4_9ASPA|nr:Putative ribonuclease H protein [Dendrobium catenatum]